MLTGRKKSYQGFSSLLESFRLLGLLRSEPLSGSPKSWTEFLAMTVERELGLSKGLKGEDVNSAVQDLVGEGSKDVIRALKLCVYFHKTTEEAEPQLTPFRLASHSSQAATLPCFLCRTFPPLLPLISLPISFPANLPIFLTSGTRASFIIHSLSQLRLAIRNK